MTRKQMKRNLDRHPRWLLWTLYHTLLVIPLWGLFVIELLEFVR
jgi:hypothetical protein